MFHKTNWIATSITIAIMLLIVGIVVYILVRQGNKGREELKKLHSQGVRYTEIYRPWGERIALMIGGLAFPLGDLILDAATRTGKYYTCKFCGFMSTEDSEFCPECKKDSKGEVRQYQCKYCFYKSTENSKYCPKCHKNDKGVNERGIS